MPVTVTQGYSWKPLAEAVHPWRLHGVSTCGSTSTLAARLRAGGRLFAPAVVVASRQTAGRGRGNNRWFSDAGTLTATFAWPVEAEVPPTQLPLVAGLAVRDAAAEVLSGLPVSVQLKWPNDVLVEGRKLAGLLCERVHNVDLIGIGLNVATSPRRLSAVVSGGGGLPATSLELAGRLRGRSEVLAVVARHLGAALSARENFAGLLLRYDRHHVLVGRQVTVDTGDGQQVRGVCKGLDPTGRLVVTQGRQAHRILSGHVAAW